MNMLKTRTIILFIVASYPSFRLIQTTICMMPFTKCPSRQSGGLRPCSFELSHYVNYVHDLSTRWSRHHLFSRAKQIQHFIGFRGVAPVFCVECNYPTQETELPAIYDSTEKWYVDLDQCIKYYKEATWSKPEVQDWHKSGTRIHSRQVRGRSDRSKHKKQVTFSPLIKYPFMNIMTSAAL